MKEERGPQEGDILKYSEEENLKKKNLGNSGKISRQYFWKLILTLRLQFLPT